MDDPKADASGMFGRGAWRAALCLALAAVGIGILWAVVRFREWRAPLVDISDREQKLASIGPPVGDETHLR